MPAQGFRDADSRAGEILGDFVASLEGATLSDSRFTGQGRLCCHRVLKIGCRELEANPDEGLVP